LFNTFILNYDPLINTIIPNYVGLHKNTGFSPLVAVIDATCSSETLVPTYRTTNPEDLNMNLHNRENIKINEWSQSVSARVMLVQLYIRCSHEEHLHIQVSHNAKSTRRKSKVVIHLFLYDICDSLGGEYYDSVYLLL
jgi:hypothetical protein